MIKGGRMPNYHKYADRLPAKEYLNDLHMYGSIRNLKDSRDDFYELKLKNSRKK